jgi:hypothetical protein
VINGILWWPQWPSGKQSEPLKATELQSASRIEIVKVDAKRGKVSLNPPSEPGHTKLTFADDGMGSSAVGCLIAVKK